MLTGILMLLLSIPLVFGCAYGIQQAHKKEQEWLMWSLLLFGFATFLCLFMGGALIVIKKAQRDEYVEKLEAQIQVLRPRK